MNLNERVRNLGLNVCKSMTGKQTFCDWCSMPAPDCECVPKINSTITIDKKVLFQLMGSHSRLAQAEYERNPAYTYEHFSAMAELMIASALIPQVMNEYFDYVDSIEKEKENAR